MKFLKTILALVMFASVATSCSNDDEPSAHDNYMEQNYTGCFQYIYKKSLNSGVIVKGTTYMFRWRADFTVDVYIKNAKFSANMPGGIDIAIEGLKWVNDKGVKVVSSTDVVPTKVTMSGNEVDASAYVIDDLKLNVFERRLMDDQLTYIPVINMSMTMGDVEVITVQKQTVYFGSTGVVNNAASTNFTSKTPYYAVTLDPDKKQATIDVYNAKFAEKMPAMNMKFAEIPFEVSNLGYKLACKELIPTIKDSGVDVPYPSYKITNLNGDATFATGMNLQFNCMEVFTVQANLGYTLPTE